MVVLLNWLLWCEVTILLIAVVIMIEVVVGKVMIVVMWYNSGMVVR